MDNKYEVYYQMLLMWLWSELHDKTILSYLSKNKVKNVAIYGMSEIGGCLYYELKKAGIEVDYVIDRNKAVFCECPVFSPENSSFPETDLIIVTAEYAISEIYPLLSKKTENKIISLQQLLCYATGLVL